MNDKLTVGRDISRQVVLSSIRKVTEQARGNKPESSVLLFMSQVPVLGSLYDSLH